MDAVSERLLYIALLLKANKIAAAVREMARAEVQDRSLGNSKERNNKSIFQVGDHHQLAWRERNYITMCNTCTITDLAKYAVLVKNAFA